MGDQILAGVGSIRDTTPCTFPAGLGTPGTRMVEDFLDTLPSPNALLTDLGLDPGLLPPNPPRLETDVYAAQRELMMRSLLDGCIPPEQRAQIQLDYSISDQDVIDFSASGPSTCPTVGQKTSSSFTTSS